MSDGDMTKVSVSFDYCPDEPDPTHPMGMSEDEYGRLTDALAMLGAEDIEIRLEVIETNS